MSLYTFILLSLIQLSDAQQCISYSPQYRIPLPIGIFLPDPFKKQLKGAIDVALSHIHNQSCILNDYYLQMIFKDTECKTSVGMKALFELMNAEPRPFALFGDACTNVNEPVAMASKYWHLLHLSYAETHAKFASTDSQEMYPTFFRIVPGDRNINEARCRLIFHFNWTRVGTVKQSDEPRFALPHESLTTKLEHGYGIKVVYTAGITHDEIENIGLELDEMKMRDVRIFVGDFEEVLASRIMCEVYQRGIYGDNYVWILPGYHYGEWWKNATATNCTAEEISTAINGHFAIQFASYSPYLQQRTIGNKTVSEVRDEIEQSCNDDCEASVLRAYAYDGLWTIAMAVHRVSMRYQRIYGTMWDPLSESGNDSSTHTRLLIEINNTSFSGATGHVRFENNERLGVVEILQWRNGSYLNVGYFDGSDEAFVLNPILENWRAPLDATIVLHQRLYIANALVILMSLLAAVGVTLAFIFLTLNIQYRNHRFIKMSSPNINNLIIAGSICTYISVILLGLDTRIVSPRGFVALCYAKTWILCLGFTFAFGSMFSKTWRVHSIFTNIRMNKKAIKDYKLFLFVGLIALLDVATLTLWALVAPFSLSIIQLDAIYMENKVIAPEIERCYSDESVVFEAIIFGTKGLLMILGCFLAWETRHVNVAALNDSKYIGMSVYNVVVMCTLGLALAFILQDRINEAYALTTFFIIFCTTLTLCLVFVPKIVVLIRNPSGVEPSYQKGLMKSVIGNQTKQFVRQVSVKVTTNERERLQRLEEDNVMWQRFLVEKTNQLWDLTQKLKELDELDQKQLKGLIPLN
uniref:Gamma-aminobutyric acid type B receptor subunit 2 n=1 Tax=Anisakis simplex TaxID=6269 RepID=A0A097IYK9_ANISI|nr:gamma aminobutyric acid type b receptor subunit 2 [Anisakis simplex]